MLKVTDCSLDSISIPIPKLPASSRDSGIAHNNSETINMDSLGNSLTDMLCFQFHSPSSRYSCNNHEKVSVAFQDMMDFVDQSSRSSFLQLLAEGIDGNIEEIQAFDPFHLKFPMLVEQPQEEDYRPKIIAAGTDQFVEISSYIANPTPLETVLSEAVEIQTRHTNQEIERSATRVSAAKIEVDACGKSLSICTDHEAGAQSGSNSENPPLGKNISCQIAAAAPRDILLHSGPSQSSSAGTDRIQSKNKRKRRPRSRKSSVEVESQRQTHITVERNRRKQMNEHLSILKSLMPGSYVQKGDQASIVGGAIEFVKELEQLLECLQAQKRRRTYAEAFSPKPHVLFKPTFPFYNVTLRPDPVLCDYTSLPADSKCVKDNFHETMTKEAFAESKSELAEVEVKVSGADAFLKILSQRRPGQLLKTIAALESLSLSIVHTNITTIEQTVLYSFSATLGAECNLNVEEIAEAVQNLFTMIDKSCTKL